MKKRSCWSLTALAAVLLLMAAPAVAHDDDGGKYDDVMARQSVDMSEAVASDAPDHSAAPTGFAPCVEGMAAEMFPCDGVDMLSWVDHGALGTTFVNDMWGWTDPETGHDYALVGATEGTVFVDISDPLRPEVLGILEAHTLDPFRPFWRDIKVHDDHAFVVSEQTGHGMQVFDLTQLRGWDGTYTFFEETAHYDGMDTAHNVAVNPDSGYAYVVGARNADRSLSCDGGLHMVDISEPTAPRFAGCFSDHGYIHDAQCVIYQGPDADHRGSEICFNANAVGPFAVDVGDFVSIVDVTDKSNPVPLARMPYDNSGYSHQGWLTPDHQHYLHGDEGDEVGHGLGTTTRVWDVGDLDDPDLIEVFENDTTSIDHNVYTEGRYAYASNYTSGLRLYDLSDVGDSGLSEAAFFDVYPANDNATFEGGTWSNYPFFRQKGVVAVSSMDSGLFVLQPRVERPGS